MILAAECTNENFRQWFLALFADEQLTCTIEEFTVFFLNLVRNQTEEYNKNSSSSSCNTPKKMIVGAASAANSISVKNATGANSTIAQSKSCGPNRNQNESDGGYSINSSKNISRDLFASPSGDRPNEPSFCSIKSLTSPSPSKLVQHEKSHVGGTLMYSEFTGDLKRTLTPIAVHHLNSSAAHAFSTPAKNISSVSSTTSTPSSFKQQQQSQQYSYHANRSGNSQSRNSQSTFHSSRYHSSNDSKSFDDNNSSTSFDTSIGGGNSSARSSHEKSKDMRRTTNASSICLGDFITTSNTTRQQKQRKSTNSAHERNSPTNQDKDFPNFTPKGKPNRIALTPKTPTLLSSIVSPTAIVQQRSDAIGTTPTKPNQVQMKPTRRVVPTRITGGSTTVTNIPNHTNEFNCPAFRSDNNILELTHEENADTARDLLKSQKDVIRRVFQQEAEQLKSTECNLRMAIHESLGSKLATTIGATASASTTIKNVPPIDLSRITNKSMLDKFIGIYSIILDLNLVTNILTEVAYLVNLINLDVNEYYERNPQMLETGDNTDDDQPLLKNINNCIYFGLGVLKTQTRILRMLDVISIKVLLENERLTTLDTTVKDNLMAVYTHKIQLERVYRAHDTTFNGALSNISGGGGGSMAMTSSSSMKVFYQQDEDTQINFPTSRESVAFKKQRDHFYSILGVWEAKHLNPAWDFEMELGRKVRAMLNEMNHPINMAHMAKLFTAQLILSCTVFQHTEAIQSDLPNIDPSKLNKLHQRLVAPSHFSTNFQFPGNQAFFKDFIIAAEHQTIFIEQLKIILTNELINTNDSTYETLNLSTIDDENEDGVGGGVAGDGNDGDTNNDGGGGGARAGSTIYRHEYIVKPETLATMSVLAKFLGLIVARPYVYEFGVNTIVDNRQIELRNKVSQWLLHCRQIQFHSFVCLLHSRFER